MHQFSENHLFIEGFSEHYESSIRPHLKAGEDERKRTLLVTATTAICVILIGLLTAYLLYSFTTYDRFKVIVLPLVFSIIPAYGIWSYGFKKLKGETKDLLVGDVCEYFDLGYERETSQPSNYLDFVQYGLLPRQNSHLYFTDRMWGEAYDTPLEATQIFMQDDMAFAKGQKTVVNFRGTIMSLDFKKRAFGKTVVLRQQGVYTPEKKHTLERLRLVDPVFERAFQAYGNDQVEARFLLTPDVMQRFVNLEESVDGQNIRFGFIKQKLLIAIETPERFKAGGMTGKLDNPARAQNIIDEVTSLYELIEGLLAPMQALEETKRQKASQKSGPN